MSTFPSIIPRFAAFLRPVLLALLASQAVTSNLHAQAVNLNVALTAGLKAYQDKEYPVAIENLAAIVKATPDGPIENVLYSLGFSYFFQKQNDDAIKTFDLYLKKYPDGVNAGEVHLVLGRLLIGQDGKADIALDHLKKAIAKPELAEEARFLAADAFIKKGDKEKAAQTLENAMKGRASGPSVLRAALQLVDLYISSNELDKAVSMLRKVESSPGYPDVIVTVNHRFVQIGDKHLEARAYSPALIAYSYARPRKQVMTIQAERLVEMRKLKENYDRTIKTAQDAKKPVDPKLEEKAAILTAMIENTDKVLAEVEKLTEYDATLQYRIGRCYFNMERYWPACVAFEVIANENDKSADAPVALFGAVICQWKLGRPDAASALCDSYMLRYPEGKHLEEVADIKSTVLLQKGDLVQAVTFLDQYLKKHPTSTNREKYLLQMANAQFQAGQYDVAAVNFDKLNTDFPNSGNAEEIMYMRGLCDFFRNNYEATIASFQAYERKFPKGQFSGDIRYRRGIILLATKEYDALLTSMRALLADSSAQGFTGQIHTLIADALSATGDNDGAATEYALAVANANGDANVLSYSLEQATMMLRGARRWAELETLWKDFLEKNPNHPMKLRGVAELSKLLTRANKKEEAQKMLAGVALKEIHNVRSEYVEMLLSQLAGTFAPARSVKKDAPKPDFDAQIRLLDDQLKIPDDQHTPIYKARVAFANSELARMMRLPDQNHKFMDEVAATNPQELSPLLLSMAGQYLFDAKEYTKAIPIYTQLRTAFPDSPFSDAAPVGLGRIYLDKKDYIKALAEFEFAINKAAGFSMLKEATFGKAQALQGLGKNDEAKKLYEEIVAAKEWRGVEKAGALYQLGELAAEAGDKGAANGYFQRIYLSHGAFPEYAAKAYIRSAEMLSLDGQHEAALNTYRELLKNAKYAARPEGDIARERTKNR